MISVHVSCLSMIENMLLRLENYSGTSWTYPHARGTRLVPLYYLFFPTRLSELREFRTQILQLSLEQLLFTLQSDGSQSRHLAMNLARYLVHIPNTHAHLRHSIYSCAPQYKTFHSQISSAVYPCQFPYPSTQSHRPRRNISHPH